MSTGLAVSVLQNIMLTEKQPSLQMFDDVHIELRRLEAPNQIVDNSKSDFNKFGRGLYDYSDFISIVDLDFYQFWISF